MSKTKTYTELYKESHKIDDAIDESYSREQILEAIQKSSILKIKAFDSGFPEGVVRENCINLLIKQVTDDRLPISVVINLAKSGSASADDIVVRILEVKGTSMDSLEAINQYFDESRADEATESTNSGGSSPIATVATTNNKTTPKAVGRINESVPKKALSSIIKNLFMPSSSRTKTTSSQNQTHSPQVLGR